MRELCAVLGDPQHQQPTVHITGTNGKGSVARLVTALLGAHDLTVGTYTSPHLETHQRADLPQRSADLGRRAGRRAHRPGRHRGAARAPAVLLRAAHGGRLPVVLRRGRGRGRRRGGPARAMGRHQRGRRPGGRAHQHRPRPHGRTGRLAPPHRRGEGRHRQAGRDVRPGGDRSRSARHLRGDPRDGACGVATSTSACTENRLAVGGRLLDLRTPGGSYDDVFLALHGAHQGENAAIALAAAEAFFGRPLEADLVAEAFAERHATRVGSRSCNEIRCSSSTARTTPMGRRPSWRPSPRASS